METCLSPLSQRAFVQLSNLEVLRMKKVCVCIVLGLFAIIALAWKARRPCRRSIRNGRANTWKATAMPNSSRPSARPSATSATSAPARRTATSTARRSASILTKAKYNEIKEDEAAAKKYILEGLEKAEAEKSGRGQELRRAVQGRPAAGRRALIVDRHARDRCAQRTCSTTR